MKRILLFIITVMTLMFVGISCGMEMSTTQQQEQSRDALMERANQAVPTPQINNFVNRQAVAKWMERMDDPSKVFYVYVYVEQVLVGYFTASTPPVNFASFLTPPDRVESQNSSSVGRILRQAPSADGLYYGAGAGDSWFFFDAESDAMVTLSGVNIITLDQPLNLEAQPLRVE